VKYKIGDVAKLLGITPEAIRFYEEQGIISPTKIKSSGYRYYDVWDIHVLIRARAYRQYGYSLSEAAELINHYAVPEIVSSLSQKEADIEKAITWNLNLLKHIRQMQSCVTQAAADVDKYRLDYRPPMYRFQAQNGYELLTDSGKRQLYNSWIEKVPFVFPSFLFERSTFTTGDPRFSYGYGVDEEYADFLDIHQSDDVDFFPSCLCVYTTLVTHSDIVLTPQSLTPTIDYMRSQGYKLSGDIVSRVVLMNKIADEYFAWNQLWLPIE